MSLLAERLLALHEALDGEAIPHAFGGAIALAYCTSEPRGTRDIDLNVFVGTDQVDNVLDSLPDPVTVTKTSRSTARSEGQVRVVWNDTPIDVFFNTHAFHSRAEEAIRVVPFETTTIPVLGCSSLIVFKAMFDRTRDWADIEDMIAAGVDASGALADLNQVLGKDPRTKRLASLIR